MTKINKVVVTGFKSFAKRTEFEFGNNFNVILGPNGSGKSNVLDALCFVLGRISSKSLRAEKTAHLIYNGGKTKQPAAKAEVSIVFDNSKKIFPIEDQAIKVSRLVKPNGQSIYRINDKKRARQEVLELLSAAKIDPDGYNIILQGDIIRFCEMTTEERRQVIEEIAGISVYEGKKQKALNELQKVDEKIKEAEILLTERKNYLKELKKDRDQAIKYKDMNDKIKQNKATYLNLRIEEKQAQHDKIRAEMQSCTEQIKTINNELAEFTKQREGIKQEIAALSDEIQEKGEIAQIKLNKSIEDMRVDLAKQQNRVQVCDSEIEKIDSRKAQLKLDSEEIEEKISQVSSQKKELEKHRQKLEADLKSVEKSIDSFRKSNQFDDLTSVEKEITEIDRQSELKQEEIQKLVEQKQNWIREKDRLEMQIQTIDDRISKIEEVEKENKQEVDGLKAKQQEFKRAVLELNKFLNESSSIAAQLSNAKNKLEKANEEFASAKAKEMGMRAQVTSNLAIKKIIEQKDSIRGIYGTVSELGKAKSQYSTALQVAAGPRVNSVVVESDEVAAKCIKYLKANKLGVASFLPLNKLKSRGVSEELKKLVKSNGVQGFATDFITFDPKFQKVSSYVFEDTVVVDNIDVARRLGIGNARMVSMDGDLADKSGAMHGGYRQKKMGPAFQEESVAKDLSESEKKVSEYEDLVSVLERKRAENDELINSLRQKKSELEGEIIKTEKGLHLESGDLEVSKNQKKEHKQKLAEVDISLKEIQDKVIVCTKELNEVKVKRQKLRDKISELSSPALLAELNTFEQKKKELSEQIMQAGSQIKNADIQANELYEQERKKLQQLLKQVELDRDDMAAEKQALSAKIAEQTKQLKEMEKQNKAFVTQYKELFAKRDKLKEELQKLEEKSIRKEESTRVVEVRANNLTLKNAEMSGELAGMRKEFEQYADVELFKSKGIDELKDEINKFERMLIQMGNVNLKALEVYDDVEKQYSSLLDKKNTLSKEKEDVMLMINEIETKKKDLFMNTFNIISDNFKKIFDSLSTKGDAQLLLENEANPFEAGVRIRVRLAGEKFLDIRSLSGGEKTLTALAFIFAIQEHEPASFYVLDEVDAALDKRNSEKLATFIKRYSDRAQYIVISHNDAVIAEAANLFGVSMDEHGVSNMVSLKI